MSADTNVVGVCVWPTRNGVCHTEPRLMLNKGSQFLLTENIININSFFDETGLTHRAAQSVNDSVICIPLKYCITVKANNDNNNNNSNNNSIDTTHKP